MDVKSLIHTEPLKDKSMWLAVLAPIVVMGAKVLGLNVDAETVGLLLGPVMTLILGSKVKQAMVAKEVVSSGLATELAASQKLLQEALDKLADNNKPGAKNE